jgi:hypothetical protein
MASSISRAARLSRPAGACAASVMVVLAAWRPALAEAPRPNEAARSAARAKLVDGVEALRRGEHGRALERFQEAYALVPSPKIHYDFGLAYLGLGRNAEALSSFERFLAEAPDAPADKRQKAALQSTALRPQVGSATVAVPGATDGTTVVVDGVELGGLPLARPIYLDPGRHQIALHLSGGAAGPVQQIDIRAGGSVDVILSVRGPAAADAGAGRAGPQVVAPASLSLPPGAPAPAAPAGALSTASTGPTGAASDPRRVAALSIGAAGGVLIAAGLTFGVLAKREGDSLSRDSANGAPPGPPTRFDPEKESRGRTYQTLEVVSLVAGAVGLGAGIVLYATTRGRVRVEPVAGAALAGANVQVCF